MSLVVFSGGVRRGTVCNQQGYIVKFGKTCNAVLHSLVHSNALLKCLKMKNGALKAIQKGSKNAVQDSFFVRARDE